MSTVTHQSCLRGRQAGPPPEDVGGAWGYAEFLEALEHPEDADHPFLGDDGYDDFDPEEFDLEKVNKGLKRYRSKTR